jgi:hypothetical protein
VEANFDVVIVGLVFSNGTSMKPFISSSIFLARSPVRFSFDNCQDLPVVFSSYLWMWSFQRRSSSDLSQPALLLLDLSALQRAPCLPFLDAPDAQEPSDTDLPHGLPDQYQTLLSLAHPNHYPFPNPSRFADTIEDLIEESWPKGPKRRKDAWSMK